MEGEGGGAPARVRSLQVRARRSPCACDYLRPLARCQQALDEFYARADNGGAVLFAVCRGKVSEGIDFADAKARAVVITGMPYPALTDPKVRRHPACAGGERHAAPSPLSGARLPRGQRRWREALGHLEAEFSG